MNSNVNYRPWVIMMCPCRFMDYTKCTTLVGDTDHGGGWAHVGAGVIWKLSVISAQFFCASKTALKINKFIKTTTTTLSSMLPEEIMSLCDIRLRGDDAHSSSSMDLPFAIQCLASNQEGQSGQKKGQSVAVANSHVRKCSGRGWE